MTDAGDYELNDGQWRSAPSVLADLADGGAIDDFLRAQGWEEFLSFGQPNAYMRIVSWQRSNEDGSHSYLVQVDDVNMGSPFMQVASFPDLRDVFARWAPAVQAAAVSGLIDDLSGQTFSQYGVVEAIAARARHGVEVTYDSVVREEQQQRAVRQARRAKAQGQEPA
jgi:hypothetical protein